MRRRRASIKVLQCHAVALDDEGNDEDGDEDDDDDDGQATSMACQAREDGDWMCHTRRVVSTSCRRTASQHADGHTSTRWRQQRGLVWQTLSQTDTSQRWTLHLGHYFGTVHVDGQYMWTDGQILTRYMYFLIISCPPLSGGDWI